MSPATWAAPGSPAPRPVPAASAPEVGSGPQAGWQPAWAAALTAHKPGIVALRPLGLGDVVEGSFAAIRRNPRTFLGLAVLTAVAVLLVAGGLLLVAYLVAQAVQSTDAVDVVVALGVTSSVTLLLFLSSATSIALSGVLAYPVGEAVLGRQPGLGETWRRTRRHLPRLLGLCLILVVPPTLVFVLVVALTVWGFADGLLAVGAVGLLGAVALAVAATWVGVRVSLAPPALVLEDLGVVPSLRRSWSLTSGLFWRTFGILLACTVLIGIVQYILSLGIQLLGMLLGLAVASSMSPSAGDAAAGIAFAATAVLGGLLSSIVTQPFLAAVLALLYTDGRIRKEAFDLALTRAVVDAGRGGPR